MSMNKHPHLHDHEVILDVRHLNVSYGKVEALHDVSLTIRPAARLSIWAIPRAANAKLNIWFVMA